MKTLAVIPNWLGDLVMSIPALRRLREDADELVGLGPAGPGELLRAGGVLDRHLPYERQGRHAGPAGWSRAIRQLRREGFDRVVAFPPSERAALLAFFSGARQRWGIQGRGRGLLLNRMRRGGPRTGEHLVDQWWSLVGGPEGHAPDPRLELGSGEVGVGALLPDRGFAVLAPTATFGPTKRWPLESYRALSRHLTERHGLDAVLVAGGAEDELELCGRLAREATVHSLAGRTDLRQLAEVMGRARIFVGNDSGPMHLAASLGVPTVGIFTSTSPEWTAPRGPRARAVGAPDLFCAPCFLPRCPYQLECLDMVSPAIVIEAADELLAESPGTGGEA